MPKWTEFTEEQQARYKANRTRKRAKALEADREGFLRSERVKCKEARVRRIARIGVDGERARGSRAWLKWQYKLTPEQVEQMIEATGRRCECCGIHEESIRPGRYKRRLHIDHCHDTMKVRGILCFKCNVMVGFAKNDPSVLRLAAAYLERNG